MCNVYIIKVARATCEVVGAEGFWVAELRVRQLKIGSKSCFAFSHWNMGNEDIYHLCFKGFIGRMLSNKIFKNSHKWSECHKGKMDITALVEFS